MSRIRLVAAAFALAQGCSGEYVVVLNSCYRPPPVKRENACSLAFAIIDAGRLGRAMLPDESEQVGLQMSLYCRRIIAISG